MFQKAKNIDTAFRQLKLISVIVIVAAILLCGFTVYKSFEMAKKVQGIVYVLANEQAVKAYATDRNDNISVQVKSHIKNFHRLFFTLSPDEQQIQQNIGSALYLADKSAKTQYDNLREANYFIGIVSGNVSTQVTTDSIAVDLNARPMTFTFFGKQEITRPTSIAIRNLITSGTLREVRQSDNNPHGILIEKWKIDENRDLSIKNR